MQRHTGFTFSDGRSQLLAPAVLIMYNLPLPSNTSRECQMLEPTQSQPASTPHSIDGDTSYQTFTDYIQTDSTVYQIQLCISHTLFLI